MFLYLGAIGLNTITSNNAFWPEHQNPLAEMSNRASSSLLAVLVSKSSPEWLCSRGSIWTSLQISFNSVAVMFLIWLCQIVTNPPFLQDKACCKPNFTLHTQFLERRVNSQPHLICIRSQNNSLLRTYPSSSNGSDEIQSDAPGFWLISLTLFKMGGKKTPLYQFFLCNFY